MTDFLYRIDLEIFYFFNHTISTPFLDKFFSLITNVNSWFIAYIILFFISFIKGGRKGRIVAIGLVVLIAITDQVGFQILKEMFHRLRPCIVLKDAITPLGCNGTFSFPSNHAFNNFAAAVFIYKFFPNLKWAVFITAILISISRVYLGLHYPSDILGGAAFGILFGYLFALLVQWLDNIYLKKIKRT